MDNYSISLMGLLCLAGIPVYMFVTVLEARVLITRNTKSYICVPSQYLERLDNGSTICKECSRCPTKRPELTPCSDNQDTVCSCPDGRYLFKGKCRKCRQCNRGQGVKKGCSRDRNTVCVQCPSGMFSNVRSSVSKCRACDVCKLYEEQLSGCFSTRDTVCGDCKRGYFRSTVLNTCERCSYCYPGYSNTTFKVAECETKSDDPQYTCMPMDRAPYGFNRSNLNSDSTTTGYDHMDSSYIFSKKEAVIGFVIAFAAVGGISLCILRLVLTKRCNPTTLIKMLNLLRDKSVQKATDWKTSVALEANSDRNQGNRNSNNDVTKALVHVIGDSSQILKTSFSTLSYINSNNINPDLGIPSVSPKKTESRDKFRNTCVTYEDETKESTRIKILDSKSFKNMVSIGGIINPDCQEALMSSPESSSEDVTDIGDHGGLVAVYTNELEGDYKANWIMVNSSKYRKAAKSLPNIDYKDLNPSEIQPDMKRRSADAVIIGKSMSRKFKRQNIERKKTFSTQPPDSRYKYQRCPFRDVTADFLRWNPT